jgi:hypothetical protein
MRPKRTTRVHVRMQIGIDDDRMIDLRARSPNV